MNPYVPANDKLRKGLPFFRFITGYFPRTIREMMKVSVVNNVRYNPDRAPADINWARSKSTDQLGSGVRHLLEREVDGKIFEEVAKDIAEKTGIERVYVLAEAAWRICAACELEIERVEKTEAEAESRLPSAALDAYRSATSALGGAALFMPSISELPNPEEKWVSVYAVKPDVYDAMGKCFCGKVKAGPEHHWVRDGIRHTLSACSPFNDGGTNGWRARQ